MGAMKTASCSYALEQGVDGGEGSGTIKHAICSVFPTILIKSYGKKSQIKRMQRALVLASSFLDSSFLRCRSSLQVRNNSVVSKIRQVWFMLVSLKKTFFSSLPELNLDKKYYTPLFILE